MPGAFAPIALRPVSHDARMNVVDHLEELRTRLIVSLATVAVAFGLCFWQNHQLLRLVNAPLAQNTQDQVRAGKGPLGATYRPLPRGTTRSRFRSCCCRPMGS
jgi:Sec-independent protein translocase protein (TatC)